MTNPEDDDEDEYSVPESTERLVRMTVEVTPALAPILAEHIANYDMLPHLYFGDLSRWVVDEAGRPEPSPQLTALLELLDSEYLTADADVENVIDASFIEVIEDEPQVVRRLGPVLRARVER